jgi:hypothetical protein
MLLLLGSMAVDFSTALRDTLRIYRFRRRIRITENKLSQMGRERGFTRESVPLSKLFPVMKQVLPTIEDHGALEDLWAMLLAHLATTQTLQPPRDAHFLFWMFLDPKTCDAIVGDLEERYRLIFKTFGRRRANFWYWTQAARSVGPIAWAWAKKIALKPLISVIIWAVARGLLEGASWPRALLNLWRRAR